MRNFWPLALATISAATLGACGGDDGGGTTVDAGGLDAPPQIDATPGNTATKLGKVCMADTDCPVQAPACARVSGTATHGWCSNTCGTSTDVQMPPANGNAMCAAAYDGTSGTPACALHDNASPAGTFNWSCGVLCGTIQGQEAGTCPTGLTCTDSLCQ